MFGVVGAIVGTVACIELAIFIWELIRQNRLLEKQTHTLLKILQTFMDVDIEEKQ